MFGRTSENRICAFCKLDHRVYLKKEVSVFDATLLLGVAGLMAFAVWGGPDLRSLLIFMGLAFVLQFFLRLRYRESVKCPHCGFDPILYSQNTEKAALRVKDFLLNRQNNPQFMLKPQPRIQPIYKTKEQIASQEHLRAQLTASQHEQEGLPAKSTEPEKGQLVDTQL
jgi:hypothetical protein